MHSVHHTCSGGKENYFIGMMLKKSRITLLDSEIVTYPTTSMMRNLLVAQVGARDHSVHLHSVDRPEQFFFLKPGAVQRPEVLPHDVPLRELQGQRRRADEAAETGDEEDGRGAR